MYYYVNTHTKVSIIPPWEDQCEWYRMTIYKMTGPDCAVICNLIDTERERERERSREQGRGREWELEWIRDRERQ